MYPPVIPCVRCPICRGGLVQAVAGSGSALRCVSGHSFDLARQGYVNLACPPPAYPGDSAQMVEARERFLTAGHYKFIAQAVAEAIACLFDRDQTGLIVEAGAGTGYYVASILDAMPGFTGLALDVSKAALRRAAKAHSRCGAALCDVWHELPVSDGAAQAVLSVFAPRNASEFRRILAPEGVLIVVTPTVSHLAELVGPLQLLSVDPNKDEAVAAGLEDRFRQSKRDRHEVSLLLSHQEVAALVGMGPSAWHVTPEEFQSRIAALPEPLTISASVDVTSYRPTPGTEPRTQRAAEAGD